MYKAWLLLAVTIPVHSKWCDSDQDSQCIINVSKHVPPESVELSYNGKVLITKGCQIISDSSWRIDATGDVTVEQGALVSVKGALTINGSTVNVHDSTLTSSASLQLISTATSGVSRSPEMLQDGNLSIGIRIVNSTIKGPDVDMSCNQSAMICEGITSIQVTDANKILEIFAATFRAGQKSQFVAGNIQIVTVSELQMEAKVPGTPTGKGLVSGTSLYLTTQGDMKLGNNVNTWNLASLTASGNDVVIADKGQFLISGSNTCQNHGGSPLVDRCQEILGAWATTPWTYPPSANDANVSFDFVLLGRTSLTISGNLVASGALLCSQQIMLNDVSSLAVSGGGCPASTIRGTAQPAGGRSLPGPPGEPWLAGGGTHVGRGGYALWSDSSGAHVNQVTVPSHSQYDRYNETRDVLPTQGASGGASGIPQALEARMNITSNVSKSYGYSLPPVLTNRSSGGGLIWLSGLKGITFGKQVSILAQGTDGVASKDKGYKFASGGGSGGQILIFSGAELKTPTTDFPLLSVVGGNGACTSHGNLWVVSGGGGGGFVGLNWTKPSPDSSRASLWVRPNFNILVNGGALGSDEKSSPCNMIPGREMLQSTYGMVGQNMSITACPGGHAGIFCDLCDKDSWSDGVGMCLPCNPIPAKGFHPNTTVGHASPDCPYSCSLGVPNVASNPYCLDPIDYALGFFGGWKGVLAILAAIVATALLLLWRRRKSATMTQPLLEDLSTSTATRGSGISTTTRCRSARNPEFQISRDHLPFHVCRVYFTGNNTGEAPWSLTQQVPPALLDLVLEHRWQQLAQEVNKVTEVGRISQRLETCCNLLYPPLAPLFLRWQRNRRARRVVEVLNEFCEAERLWTWIREPGKELLARFGCDRKATLAHIDILDFARSRLDWAPVNLLKDAWLLPVHGHGTFADPFEVDISDPVLQLLEHTDFGSTAVLSVLSTFNRAARKIQQADLRKDDDDTLQQLHEKMEQCASQCGLAGCVQACLISTNRRGPLPARSPEHGGSLRSPTAEEVTSENSFMDLVEQGQSSPNTRPWSRRNKRSELRLCLVFTQFSTLASLAESVSSNETGNSKAPALTTPMSLQAFNDLLRCSASNIGDEQSASREGDTCHNRGLQRILLRWGKGSEGAPARTLVSLTCLLAFDLMVVSLVFWILYKTSTLAGLVWFLLPPFAQPLAWVFGLLFLITEDPDLGRLFAALDLFGMWNAAFALLVLLFSLLLDSFLFDIIAMAVVLCVKAMLFISAAAHVASLEVANDLSYIGAPQGDFVAGFFAPSSRRSQVSSTAGLHDSDVRKSLPDSSVTMFDAIGPRETSVTTQNSFPALTRSSSRSAASPPASSSRIIIQTPSPF